MSSERNVVARIYLVTNSVNGKRYVGVTRKTAAERFKGHCYTAHHAAKTFFHRAIVKYGAEAFTVEEIAVCFDLQAALDAERSLIAAWEPEYNQTNGGEFTIGRRIPREVADRIAAANRGLKRTPEHNALNSRLAKERYRTNPEWRAKIVASLDKARGLVDEEKRRRAAGDAQRGRVWSKETRAKLSASCMGRRYSREVIERGARKKDKPVRCVTTGADFRSVSDAAAKTGSSICGVSRVCRGDLKTSNGLRFCFVTQ
jgi:group I intron endonuclease